MAETESPARHFGSHQRSQAAAVVPGIAPAQRCHPTAAELPVAEARLRTSLEWLDADCERAVDARCAVADSSARARAAVFAHWSHRYAPAQCNAPKMEDSNVEGKRE